MNLSNITIRQFNFLKKKILNIKKTIKNKLFLGVKKHIFFPHFPRLFPASSIAEKKYVLIFSGKFLCFIFLLIIFFANISTSFKNEKQLTNFSNEQEIEKNINLLIGQKKLQLAKYINKIGRDNFPNNLELLRQEDLIYQKINEKRIILGLINKWKKILTFFPNYRDAYANLVYLNLKIGERNEGEKYLKVLKTINPNWQTLQKFNF